MAHMDEKAVRRMFEESGASFTGHFQLSSGRHSDHYLQSALVLQKPERALALGAALAERFAGEKIDAVVGPALGGIVVAFALACRLPGTRAVFAEREAGHFTLRRGFGLESSENVLIAEDVITTGASTREVMELVRSTGARVAGVAALAGRSEDPVDFGVPSASLLRIPLRSFPPGECPLCRAGVPLVKPGSRS